MIRFRSVSKSYGEIDALRNLSFELHSGEVFGYIGPNGAGKTTTIKILTGLIRDYAGEVEIQGNTLQPRERELYKRVGYLPQDVGFQEWRTVEQALQTFGLLSGIERSALPAAIDRAVEKTGIGEHQKRRIVHLSGGTIQRLRLAQAILHDPEILVLDEPLSGLDPASRFQVKQIISELAGENQLVLVSSHILSELEGVATRIGILHGGQMIETGTPAELRDRYQVGRVVEVSVKAGARIGWEALGRPPVIRTEIVDPDSARLHIDPKADLDDAMTQIMKRIISLSLPVRSIRHAQPSLEEVYLRLTAEGQS